MAVAKRQRKEETGENGTKENPRTGVRTSGETNSPPGQPNLHGAGSGGGDKTFKKRSQEGLRPALMLGAGNGNPLQYFCLENPMDGSCSPWGC